MDMNDFKNYFKTIADKSKLTIIHDLREYIKDTRYENIHIEKQILINEGYRENMVKEGWDLRAFEHNHKIDLSRIQLNNINLTINEELLKVVTTDVFIRDIQNKINKIERGELPTYEQVLTDIVTTE